MDSGAVQCIYIYKHNMILIIPTKCLLLSIVPTNRCLTLHRRGSLWKRRAASHPLPPRTEITIIKSYIKARVPNLMLQLQLQSNSELKKISKFPPRGKTSQTSSRTHHEVKMTLNSFKPWFLIYTTIQLSHPMLLTDVCMIPFPLRRMTKTILRRRRLQTFRWRHCWFADATKLSW